MDEKKLYARGFQLKTRKHENMRCKLLQKRSTRKTRECSKHLRNIVIEKDIFSELNRCIFQISQKYSLLELHRCMGITGLKHVFTRLSRWPMRYKSVRTYVKSSKQKKCFLKVLTTFYKEIGEIINTIVMKESYQDEDQKIQHINSKS